MYRRTMSFKYAAQRISDGHYVLPCVGSMKIEAHAFLSDALYASSDEGLWAQIANGASYEGVIGAYLMPDCHLGYGVPVGSVIVTEDTLIQAASGYDISCFTGDTRVPLVDGRVLSMEDLVGCYGNGESFYVYSITPEGYVTAGKAFNPRRTKRQAELVEVELDNGALVRCTPDHRFMLRDGSYCEASSLAEGASLMPLYRYHEDGYCVVKHPADETCERMYRVAFRETHGYVPQWPRVIHHDLFHEANPNPSKRNDDPRFLVEMDQKAHFELHSRTAKERLRRGEIWGARAHQLYPEMYSQMASDNMTLLHADPDFRKRHAQRMSETNRRCREAGKYAENWSQAGRRGRDSLVAYNQSELGRQRSREVGLANKGRKRSKEVRERMSASRRGCPVLKTALCEICKRSFKKGAGLSLHMRLAHPNHKVVKVRRLSVQEDVYCLTVEGYANFALEAGVFVHNCGILHLKVPLKAKSIRSKEKRWRWINEVEKRIATGVGSRRPSLAPKFAESLIEDVLRHGVRPLNVPADLCERQFVPIQGSFDSHKIDKARSKAIPQIGSVGGGNHFIELQCDVADGQVWVMIHCGSRGYGWPTTISTKEPRCGGCPRTAGRIPGSESRNRLARNTGPTTTRLPTTPSPTVTSSFMAFRKPSRRSLASRARSTTRSATTSSKRRLWSFQTAPRRGASSIARAQPERSPRGTPTWQARLGRRRDTPASSRARCTRGRPSSFPWPGHTNPLVRSTTARAGSWLGVPPKRSSVTSKLGLTPKWLA